MHKKVILVIDTGSSSIRGILFDSRGTILYKQQLSNFMPIKDYEIAEQDSQTFCSCLKKICVSTVEFCAREEYSISALCFTSQRSSVLPLDEKGIPLSPIFMWYDKRSLPLCSEIIETYANEIYSLCGLRLTPVLSAPKMLWFKRSYPELYRKSYKLVGIHDYLLFLCTGNYVTDSSLASRTGLFDIVRMEWSQKLINIFEIDAKMLCRIISPGDIAGHITSSFSKETGIPEGLPVISCGGDQQCSQLGQGIFKEGDIGITSGTASYTTTLVSAPIFDDKMRTNLSVSTLPGKYMLETSNMSSGSVYSWIRDTFYSSDTPFERLDQDILSSPIGANNLIMIPDLAGKGCPQWNSRVKGSFHNISFATKKQDFARAALEAICAEIAECYSVLKEQTQLSDTVTSAGGLSRFSGFQQMLSDMLSIPITSCYIEETTALGAWAVASPTVGFSQTAEDALLNYKNMHSEEIPIMAFYPNALHSKFYNEQAKIRLALWESYCNEF